LYVWAKEKFRNFEENSMKGLKENLR